MNNFLLWLMWIAFRDWYVYECGPLVLLAFAVVISSSSVYGLMAGPTAQRA